MEEPESAQEAIARKLELLVKENYSQVSFQLQNDYGLPELDPIRHEICYCILVGCHQAAITLTNHLLENALKTFLIWHDCIHRPTEESYEFSMAKASERYNGKKLFETIQLMGTKGLITSEQASLINEFRETFRNAFSHADKKKTFGSKTMGIDVLGLVDGRPEIRESQEVNIFDYVPIQGIMQAVRAENESVYYFSEIDSLVRSILAKLDQDHKTSRGKV